MESPTHLFPIGFRKLDEDQTETLLSDLIGLLGDHPQRDTLLRAVGAEVTPRPVRRLPLADSATFVGGFAGGESDAHRRLKEFVAANPVKVGLPRNARAQIEFPYISGDQVDVRFDMSDGSAAVVEIETIDGWTGAHQCIKYRALLEAELGQPLGSGRVSAIIVAHSFDARTLAFADRYAIRAVQLRI